MLNDQLRHYLPSVSCCCVCIVSSVNLKHAGPSHNLLGFASVYERSYHVNVSVKYVVLRVLVSTVNAFFSEHYCDIRTCNAGDVGMVVDWTANFIFDEVDSLSLCSNLLTSNRNTTDTLRSTFHKSVDVGLTHVSDNH